MKPYDTLASDAHDRGQIIALFASRRRPRSSSPSALVIDGGNALVAASASQNASDFAALAGARIVATWIDGDTTNGTDANVRAAITSTLAANGADPVTFRADPDGAGPLRAGRVRQRGRRDDRLRRRGRRRHPAGHGRRDGRQHDDLQAVLARHHRGQPMERQLRGDGTRRLSRPALLAGRCSRWASPRRSSRRMPFCTGAVGSSPDCHAAEPDARQPERAGRLRLAQVRRRPALHRLRPGHGPECRLRQQQAVPPGRDRQQRTGGNEPPGNSFGCCTAVSGDPDLDRIGSLPGNKASADCDYYIDNEIVVTVPIWDYAGGTGANGWYHIIGFAGFQITECDGGKDISGVWRKAV